MTNISFNDQELTRLRTLLDLRANQQPSVEHILMVMERGAEIGMELSLSFGTANPLLLDARRRQLAARRP